MDHSQRLIIDEERLFKIEDLFFSITDPRGVILHRNDVFTRISGYTTEELIGAPHSILRHPHMPRVVFKLLWDTIEHGQSIAAYVKNLAKDGRYYWVMAVVTPIDQGYLSVRLKPTSALLPVVQQLYQELLNIEQAIEKEPKRRPEAMAASGERLGQLLNLHGFSDYRSFMETALATEMAARFQILEQQTSLRHHPRPVAPLFSSDAASLAPSSDRTRLIYQQCDRLDECLQQLFACLDQFREMNVMLLEQSRAMLQNAASIRLLSMNASIAAHRIGSQASTLGVVAQSMGQTSHESQQLIDYLTAAMADLVTSLSNLIFEVAATKLQSEISLAFLQEQIASGGRSHVLDNVNASLAVLFDQLQLRTESVYRRLNDSDVHFAKLRNGIEQLIRNINRLRFVQFAGVKESAPLPNAEAFRVVFEDARAQIERTRHQCDLLYERAQQNHQQIHAIHAQAPNALLAASQLLINN